MTRLSNLVEVKIDDNLQLADISPLANKPGLEVVGLYQAPIDDLSPLFGSPGLRSVNIGKAGGVPCEQISALRQRIRKNAQVRGVKHCQS